MDGLKRRRAGESLPNDSLWARNGCCLSEETVFRVRCGPDYKHNKQKEPSAPPFFVPVAVDLFRTPSKASHITRHIQLPDLPAELAGVCNGVPPYFVVNVQLPDYEVGMFNAQTDGPGWSFVMYFLIKPETRAMLLDLPSAPSALRLLKDFIENDDEQMRSRFKAIGNFLNPEECNFPSLLRKLIAEYNMKPLLTRPQHTFHTDHQTYFEADIDVHLFGFIGRRGFASARSTLKGSVMDAGFVIEARCDEEMPENMIGICHADKLDLYNPSLEFVDFVGELALCSQGRPLPLITRSPGPPRSRRGLLPAATPATPHTHHAHAHHHAAVGGPATPAAGVRPPAAAAATPMTTPVSRQTSSTSTGAGVGTPAAAAARSGGSSKLSKISKVFGRKSKSEKGDKGAAAKGGDDGGDDDGHFEDAHEHHHARA